MPKINDGKGSKDNFGSQPMERTKKKNVEHIGVWIETIKSHQVQVKKAFSKILSRKIPKD